MNIYEKMSAITAEITAVAKNLNVGWGSQSYKAVGEADVLAAVKPIEAKYKVYSYPHSREITETGILTSIKKDGTESKQQFLRICTVYRFVDMEKPEEYIDITTYGDGVDSQDKAPGKAMTYADKYALLKAYKIITGDDPDQDASEPMKGKQKKQTKAQQQAQPQPPQQAQPPQGPPETMKPEQVNELLATFGKNGINPDFVAKLYNLKSFDNLLKAKYENIMAHLEDIKKKQEESNK